MAVLDGKKFSKVLQESLKLKVSDFVQTHGRSPGLATILVGNDSASGVYIKNKRLACKKTGILSYHKEFSDNIDEQSLLNHITSLNEDTNVDGILLQLPLPKALDAKKLLNSIKPDKDVDGFHPYNLGQLLKGEDGFIPCTPYGIIKLLHEYDIDPASKHCVILGRSNIVGKPMSMLMIQENATVTVCHSKTDDIENHVRQADIVIAAVGQAKFVKEDWIQKGAVVIDVGINRQSDVSLCGDVDFETIQHKASWITPVPGGVGPLTIAMLLENTLLAAQKHSNNKG